MLCGSCTRERRRWSRASLSVPMLKQENGDERSWMEHGEEYSGGAAAEMMVPINILGPPKCAGCLTDPWPHETGDL